MSSGEAFNGQTRICYERLGNPSDDPLILISGLGSQMLYWTLPLCDVFIQRGFQVIRFDNRDTGLSSKTPGLPPSVKQVLDGGLAEPPYTLSDMAADTIAVLDALDLESAHIVGLSLGGMIAQTVAIEYPLRCKSLTSMMSCAWRRPNMQTCFSGAATIYTSPEPDPATPEAWIEEQINEFRAFSGPYFDEAYQREILRQSVQRSYHPYAGSYQMAASLASGDRRSLLQKLTLPSLVIHGGKDTLMPVEAGKETADAIPGCRFLYIEDMGHNLLPPYWDQVSQAIAEIAGKC